MLWWLPLVVLVVAFAIYFRIGTVRRPPRRRGVPVSGRYRALNSPADKVPSHGLHAYGQTYAIDLVLVPTGDGALSFPAWPLTRRHRLTFTPRPARQQVAHVKGSGKQLVGRGAGIGLAPVELARTPFEIGDRSLRGQEREKRAISYAADVSDEDPATR